LAMAAAANGGARSNGTAQSKFQTSKYRWVWRQLESAPDGEAALKDPSALPVDAKEHRRRYDDNLWGANYARLILTEVVSKGEDGLLQVQAVKSRVAFNIPIDAGLPWHEGLLVLELLCQSNLRQSWVAAFKSVVENAKQSCGGSFKPKNYVQTLLNVAITGPNYVDGDGKVHRYRRRRMCTVPPKELGKTESLPSQTYAVDALVDYMPPWEAIFHRKCGLYQDYYLVQWAPPHDEVNLKETECGSDKLGCSWEPDECLPDGLDADRVNAKELWLSKEHTPLFSPAKIRKRRSEAEEKDRLARITKMAKTTHNGFGQLLWCDFSSPSVKHSWRVALAARDRSGHENEIKKGWPRQLSDYPAGYEPAKPPGPCGQQCDCMEDWHLGQSNMPQKTQDLESNMKRAVIARSLVEGFAASGLALARGEVSQQCHFQSINQVRRVPPAASLATAWDLRRVLLGALKEVATNVPVEALTGSGEDAACTRELFIPALARVSNAHGYLPSRYVLDTSPRWLGIDAPSGELLVSAAEVPAPMPGNTQQVSVRYMTYNGDTYENEATMACVLNGDGNRKNRLLLGKLALQVAREATKAKPAHFKAALLSRLAPVFDFQRSMPLEVPLGIWAHAVSEAALLASTFATCHVSMQR